MSIEIPSNFKEMVDLRVSIAPRVTLPPQFLDLNKQLVDQGFEMMVRPFFTGSDEMKANLFEQLSFLVGRIRARVSYPISANHLSAAFVASSEVGRFEDAALEGLRQQKRLGEDMALHMFAHGFDISAGITTATQRIFMVEDELNGFTSAGIERRDQSVREAGVRISAADFAVVYGESTAYARELAKLLREDKSPLSGTILFTDLITRVREKQFVPGILPESFPDLVVVGIVDAQRVYEIVHPYALEAVTKNQ